MSIFARLLIIPVLALLFSCQTGLAQSSSVHSKLWGKDGERWSPTSRLPGFSHAGYRSGNARIPTLPVVSNLLDFGAKPDGKTDCAEALRKAIAATKEGAILIPEGRYVLGSVVEIKRSNIVLRGEGMGKTVLLIPNSLQDLLPREANVDGTKHPYSFSGGFIHLRGRTRGGRLTTVAKPARRGDQQLELKSTEGIEHGALLRLQMNNHADLGKHLHGGRPAGEATLKERKHFVDWVARVTKVERNRVELDRPLRVDVELDWQPEIRSFDSSVREVGIEKMSFQCAGSPKKKHLLEEGFNAVFIQNAVDCWARELEFIDADNALNVRSSRFCSFEKIHVRAEKREGKTGHHAIWASACQECLFDEFEIATTFVHDLTVEGFAHGNVFKNGRGKALNLDHHRNGPYENLFSYIDVGNPRRLFASGGRGDRGPHSGVRSTFWNLHWREGELPTVPDWPEINFIGDCDPAVFEDLRGRHIEIPEAPPPIEPKELHAAQLERRRQVESTRRSGSGR